MERAVGVGSDALDAEWPGHVFKLPSNAYTALLGTPHGKGVVHLIMQHSSGLRGKDIESVTVFTTDETEANLDSKSYHLLFTLTGDGN